MLGHHQHACETPSTWLFAGWQMMARLKWYLEPLSPHQLKNRSQIWTPSDKTFWICAGIILLIDLEMLFFQHHMILTNTQNCYIITLSVAERAAVHTDTGIRALEVSSTECTC